MKIGVILFWLFIVFTAAYFVGQWLRAGVEGTIPL